MRRALPPRRKRTAAYRAAVFLGGSRGGDGGLALAPLGSGLFRNQLAAAHDLLARSLLGREVVIGGDRDAVAAAEGPDGRRVDLFVADDRRFPLLLGHLTLLRLVRRRREWSPLE